MAFGQSSGPPASRRQVDELLVLVQRAGYNDFREARHPFGFTQRQANGKFSREEADGFIEQLSDDSIGDSSGDSAGRTSGPSSPPRPRTGAATAAERTAASQARAIAKMPAELLAAELQRRGWAVMEP